MDMRALKLPTPADPTRQILDVAAKVQDRRLNYGDAGTKRDTLFDSLVRKHFEPQKQEALSRGQRSPTSEGKGETTASGAPTEKQAADEAGKAEATKAEAGEKADASTADSGAEGATGEESKSEGGLGALDPLAGTVPALPDGPSLVVETIESVAAKPVGVDAKDSLAYLLQAGAEADLQAMAAGGLSRDMRAPAASAAAQASQAAQVAAEGGAGNSGMAGGAGANAPAALTPEAEALLKLQQQAGAPETAAKGTLGASVTAAPLPEGGLLSRPSSLLAGTTIAAMSGFTSGAAESAALALYGEGAEGSAAPGALPLGGQAPGQPGAGVAGQASLAGQAQQGGTNTGQSGFSNSNSGSSGDGTGTDDPAGTGQGDAQAQAVKAKADAQAKAQADLAKAGLAKQQDAAAARVSQPAPLPMPDGSLAGGAQTMASTQRAAADATRAEAPHRPQVPQNVLADQIAVQVHKAVRGGLDRINIQLRPESLGRVDVAMEVSKDGKLQAVIQADKPETLELLMRDAQHLERALQGAGLDTSGGLQFALRGDGGGSLRDQRELAQMLGEGRGQGGAAGEAEADGAASQPAGLPSTEAMLAGAGLDIRV